MIEYLKNLFSKDRSEDYPEVINVINEPDNVCPTCSSDGYVTSGVSVIKIWKCVKCNREWMTIKRVRQ